VVLAEGRNARRLQGAFLDVRFPKTERTKPVLTEVESDNALAHIDTGKGMYRCQITTSILGSNLQGVSSSARTPASLGSAGLLLLYANRHQPHARIRQVHGFLVRRNDHELPVPRTKRIRTNSRGTTGQNVQDVACSVYSPSRCPMTDVNSDRGTRVPSRVLALTPSRGLGGGIEVYAQAVLDAMRVLGVEVIELAYTSPLRSSGFASKARYVAQAFKASEALHRTDTEVLCFHAGLLPAAMLARRRLGTARPITIFFYDVDDIWTSSTHKRVLRRRPSVHRVTISSFSAGMMVGDGDVAILVPSIPATLVRDLLAIDRAPPPTQEQRVLSVLRLGAYARKGGRELVGALARLRSEGYSVTLTLAGRDAPSELLDRDLEDHGEWLKVVRSPSAAALVGCYAKATLFALATRQQGRPRPAGEGFGIVLAEAALAGLPVLGPAYGGSRDAFIEGVTGASPRDQSLDSLTDILRWMFDNPNEVETMGANGRRWARRAFDPDSYPARVADVVWGQGTYVRWLGVEFR
jgi:phosphatidyl-myo-inositol dimannoside synthase